MTSFSSLYCKLVTYFTPFSSVSIVEFEQVNVWAVSELQDTVKTQPFGTSKSCKNRKFNMTSLWRLSRYFGNHISFAILRLQSKFHCHNLVFELQSNLYKTITLGTTQKWSSWAGGCFIKHLQCDRKCGRSWQVLFFFPTKIFAWIKDLQLSVFWCHSWRLKVSKVYGGMFLQKQFTTFSR